MTTITRSLGAGLMALTAACALTACSSDGDSASSSAAAPATTQASASQAPASQLPTAAELNAVLAKAMDPNTPIEEKTKTVQDSETAPELFDTMAKSQAESGATFEVVDPVLPGYTPNSALSTVKFNVPNEGEQTADNVEFIYEDGQWKLQKSWACTLVTNIVTPDQVPDMCKDQMASSAPAASEAPAQ